MRDFLLLVADKNMESMLKGYLSRPGIHAALGCGLFNFDARRDLHVAHGQNDPGLYTRAKEFLQPYAASHRHAAVVMDAEWDGAPPVTDIEQRLTTHLEQAGWPAERHCAVVIDPELENWVWQDSPHVCAQLGFAGNYAALRSKLEHQKYWHPGEAKPHRPKEAVEETLRTHKIPRSSAIYQKLAQHIGTAGCTDNAFLKLRNAMRLWFPLQSQ